MDFLGGLLGVAGGIVGGLLGIRKPANRIANAAVAIPGQLQTQLNSMQAQIAETKNEIMTKMMPQVNRAVDAVVDSMEKMVVSVQNVEVEATKALQQVGSSVKEVGEEATKTLQQLESSIKIVGEKTVDTLEKVDDTIITVKFSLEIFMIILFLFCAKICGYLLNRLENKPRLNAFYKMQKDFLHMLSLVCICSGFIVIGRIVYIFFMQQSEATPIEVILLTLTPLFLILGYKFLCLLAFILPHVFSFLRFVLWAPYMIFLYPIFYIMYLTFIAPFVWLYRVYQARLRLQNQYGIVVMHSLVIILPMFLLKMTQLLVFLTPDDFSHLPVVYASLATYTLFYLIALCIKRCYQ